jgi:hypothetical protein
MFEGTIIDQLIAAVQNAEDRMYSQAATAELTHMSSQVANEPAPDVILAGVA